MSQPSQKKRLKHRRRDNRLEHDKNVRRNKRTKLERQATGGVLASFAAMTKPCWFTLARR